MEIPFIPKFFLLILILTGRQEGIHAKLIETFWADNGQKPLANGKVSFKITYFKIPMIFVDRDVS